MKITIVTPAPPDSRYGNRITAVRWATILRGLGNRVSILQTYDSKPYDILVALHARRSHASIIDFRRDNPSAPIIVALTGTDLYRDIRRNRRAQESLDISNRIVVLQPKAIEELRPSWRRKTRVIYQSVEDKQAPMVARSSSAKTGTSKEAAQTNGNFDVCVIGHLRDVKDPFRTAMAARSLPDSSRIRVLQIGGAMTDAMAKRAHREMDTNERYRWLDEQPQSRVRSILSRSSLCVLSSRIEGGANVLSEAIAATVPILASRVDGNVGVLGKDYPGYFEVGNTKQLARLLTRAETSTEYLAKLKAATKGLAVLVDPSQEEQAWSDLIGELSYFHE
jgi:putative glycosyltransferase (TIGR04348 family)